jgi:hypothetical protein
VLAFIFRRSSILEAADQRMASHYLVQQRRAAAMQAAQKDEGFVVHP